MICKVVKWVLDLIPLGQSHVTSEVYSSHLQKTPIYSKHPYHTITYHTIPYHTITYPWAGSIIFGVLVTRALQKYSTSQGLLTFHYSLYLCIHCICVFAFVYLHVRHLRTSYLTSLYPVLSKNIAHAWSIVDQSLSGKNQHLKTNTFAESVRF